MHGPHALQAKSKVRLVNSIPRGCPPVLGDTGRIIQILHNLIGNACKFVSGRAGDVVDDVRRSGQTGAGQPTPHKLCGVHTIARGSL